MFTPSAWLCLIEGRTCGDSCLHSTHVIRIFKSPSDLDTIVSRPTDKIYWRSWIFDRDPKSVSSGLLSINHIIYHGRQDRCSRFLSEFTWYTPWWPQHAVINAPQWREPLGKRSIEHSDNDNLHCFEIVMKDLLFFRGEVGFEDKRRWKQWKRGSFTWQLGGARIIVSQRNFWVVSRTKLRSANYRSNFHRHSYLHYPFFTGSKVLSWWENC